MLVVCCLLFAVGGGVVVGVVSVVLAVVKATDINLPKFGGCFHMLVL